MKLIHNHPPRIGNLILKWFLFREEFNEKSGDLAEIYYYLCDDIGVFKAKLWFWAQLIKTIPVIILNTIYWSSTMLKNYLKTAFRNFQKNKIYTGINMFGLSIALAFAILVFLFIKDELSYNKFHKNANSIYSVINRDNYFNYNYRYVPNAVGPGIKEFFPEVKYAVRITGQEAVVRNGDIIFNERINFVEPAFFKIFSFKLIQGNDESVLESENSIVLTRTAAAKYFGNENPMGKVLSCTFGQKHRDFLVAGVTEDVPSNSTVQYEMLININNYTFTRNADALSSWTWPRSHLYIQLHEGATPQQIESRFPYFVQQNFKQVEEERSNSGSWLQEGATIEYWLQNMNDIYLESQIISGDKSSDIRKSIIFGGIGLLVLIIACINFTNLSIGRASSRAIEIGLRKVLGAERRNLINQFWIESIVTVIISMLIGLVLAVLLLPLFNDIASKNLILKDLINVTNVLLFIFSGFLVGVAAGCFPGLALSRFQPVEIIKGKLKIGGKNFITKSLIVVQFSVSIFLIISTFTMGKQIKYINNKDLGFEKKGIVIIKTMDNDFQANEKIANFYKNKANNLEEIISISGCVFPFATHAGEGMWEFNGKKRHFSFTGIYYNYVKTMGMRLVAGRDFSKEYPTDKDAVVVNEEFVRQFEIEEPIGLRINNDPPYTTIIGVVKDYNYSSLKLAVEPVMHWIDNRFGPRNLLLRISTENIGRSLSVLEDLWKEIQPDKPFTYSFFDDELNNRYQDERRWNSIVLYSSVLSILITCLGLIGITAITISRRIKEIGIRKVLGASVTQITRLLVNEFLLLVAISNSLTWPIGYYFMNKWLQNFAYRTNIGLEIFLFSGAPAFVIAILTISYQAFKAATGNPVDALKYE